MYYVHMTAGNLWKLGKCRIHNPKETPPHKIHQKTKWIPEDFVGLEENSLSKSIGLHFKCQGCKKNFLKALQLGMAQTFARLLNYTPKTGSQKALRQLTT